MNGITGTIYGLWKCSLIELNFKNEIIKELAEKLIDRTNNDYRLLINQDMSFPQSGLAHGFSGISLGYMALYCHTNDLKYKKHMLELIKLEDVLFTGSLWPDMRTPDEHNKYGINSWCYGSTGVLLSRLIIRRYTGIDSLAKFDLKYIIKNVLDTKSKMNLCHGRVSDVSVINLLIKNYKLDLKYFNIFDKSEYIKIDLQSLNEISLFKGITGIYYYLVSSSKGLSSIETLYE